MVRARRKAHNPRVGRARSRGHVVGRVCGRRRRGHRDTERNARTLFKIRIFLQ